MISMVLFGVASEKGFSASLARCRPSFPVGVKLPYAGLRGVYDAGEFDCLRIHHS